MQLITNEVQQWLFQVHYCKKFLHLVPRDIFSHKLAPLNKVGDGLRRIWRWPWLKYQVEVGLRLAGAIY